MAILAQTSKYLVEFESGILTISRYPNGEHIALTGKGIAGEFRSCLKTHDADRVAETFIRMDRNATWRPSLYKAGRMPGQTKAGRCFAISLHLSDAVARKIAQGTRLESAQ